MSDVFKLKDDVLIEENREMPSKKHSRAQTNITGLLFNDERFTTFVELSLDATRIDLSQFELKAKDELIPDICAYTEPPSEQEDELEDDEMRVTEIPDLAIEVLSPRQAISDLLFKIKAYFALGVRSCWLVMPSVQVIKVYSLSGTTTIAKTFDTQRDTEVVDDVMDIHLPIQKIFNKKRSPMPPIN
jgi:Uma2 family endonuclease